MLQDVDRYLTARMGEFDQIAQQRRADLADLAQLIIGQSEQGHPVRLNFICTHNSRRSHLAQIWTTIATHWLELDDVKAYSGGTEATAFNPRAVSALRRAGLRIEKTTHEDNPIYHVYFTESAPPIESFSKVYDQAPIPTNGFYAVMTCSSADQACPMVAGADRRLVITYEDPKAYDGTVQEAQQYDERCAQIAREMLYAFSLIFSHTHGNESAG